MELKTGYILHCSGKSLLSRLIMRFTKGKFSHTAIVLEIGGKVCVVGAQNNGVNIREFKEWQNEFKYKYSVSIPIYQAFNKEEIANKILSKVGVTKYDYFSLLIAQPFYLLTRKWIGNKKNAAKKFYCSEFVGWCMICRNGTN